MLGYSPIGSAPLGAGLQVTSGPAAGALSVTLDDVVLTAAGTLAKKPIIGGIVLTLDDIGLVAVGQLAKRPITAALSVVLDDVVLVASSGQFPFRRSESRTHRIGPLLSDRQPVFHVSPGAKLDFSFDWAPWEADGDDLVTGYAVQAPAGVERSGVMKNGSIITVWLSVVDHRAVHSIRCTINSASGRTDSRAIQLVPVQ